MADDGQIIYGKRPVEEAERGRRGGAAGLAGAGDLGRGAGAALRVAGPPGGRRRGRSLSLCRARARCSRREDALLVALDQVQDPRNLGAVCRSAEFAGAAGRRHPRAPLGRGDRGRLQGLGRRRRAPRDRPRPQPRRLARRGEGRPASGSGAPTPTPKQAPWAVDLTGPTVLVLGGEGKGIRPRVAAACDGLVALPRRGRVESLNVSAAATALLFEARPPAPVAPATAVAKNRNLGLTELRAAVRLPRQQG